MPYLERGCIQGHSLAWNPAKVQMYPSVEQRRIYIQGYQLNNLTSYLGQPNE